MGPKIRGDILLHSIGYFLIPGIIVAVSYPLIFGSDESKQRVLEEKYGSSIKQSRENRAKMQTFFDKVQSGDQGVNDQLDQLLLNGKHMSGTRDLKDKKQVKDAKKSAQSPQV